MHVLILGTGGAGKSYIATRMKKKGFYVIDEGLHIRLSRFTDKSGKSVQYII